MTSGDTQREIMDTAAQRELLTIEQVQELLQVGRTFAYSLVRVRFKTVSLGASLAMANRGRFIETRSSSIGARGLRTGR